MAKKKKKKKSSGKSKQNKKENRKQRKKENKKKQQKQKTAREILQKAKNIISQLIKRQTLQDLKTEAFPIIEEANRRWSRLEFESLTSTAVERAMESGQEYFSVDNLETKPEVIAEITRARVFLADKSSTVEGAFIQNAQISAEIYKGKFGNQWKTEENNFKKFDTKVINEDIASEVFRAYRNLESLDVNAITGASGYGSENLIIAMYDMAVQGQDPLVYGYDLLESWKNMNTEAWKKKFENINNSPIFYGNKSSDDYISKLDF